MRVNTSTSYLRCLLFLICICPGVLCGQSGQGVSDSPLSIEMNAFLVVQEADGHVEEVAADEASPGDVIVYRATFSNHGESPLSGLRPQIPIPSQMVYLSGSAKPTADAILLQDGTAIPYTTQDQPDAPELSAYRGLRWNVGTLEPGQTFEAELKVRLPEE